MPNLNEKQVAELTAAAAALPAHQEIALVVFGMASVDPVAGRKENTESARLVARQVRRRGKTFSTPSRTALRAARPGWPTDEMR